MTTESELQVAGYCPTRTNDGNYIFDEARANKPVEFCHRFLKHVKGEKGKPFILSDKWQIQLTRNLFGWIHKDTHQRRYRTAYVELPRKNGKSTYASFLSLVMLACDGEQGAECYFAATDRDQSSLCFDICASFIRQCSELAPRFKILDSRKRILYPKTHSFLSAIACDAAGSHGYNSHFVCLDELHAQSGREFYDVLKTSQGSRKQPLFFSITTAGYDRQSICWQEHDYSSKVRDGLVSDPTHLPIIFGANESDDWTSEATHRKANPCYGESISGEYLAQQCRKAQEQPSYENTFKRLHLNCWTEQEHRFFKMSDWENCYRPLTAELEQQLTQTVCYGGLDLSDTLDLTCFSLAFPLDDGQVVIKSWFFIPENTASKRKEQARIPYPVWSKDPNANLFITPGKRQDQRFIESKIMEIYKTYDVQSVAFDRYNASILVRNLEDNGVKMVEWGQGFVSMNAPTKEIEALVVENRLNHLGNPVLTFCAQNASIATDQAGNIKVVKPDHTSALKVDGIVASIMAIGLWQVEANNSPYFTGEIIAA